MKVREVRKAIVPLVTGTVALAGLVFGEQYVAWATPEIIVALGSAVSSGLVWLISNDTA